ncbi:hypothetical protein G4Z16_23510 [Streptomyces bathyalis]|uniref:BetI-type transcriptional repressor C-terminal domain-containing protein n=1 Tax=Streptomyces bathyalis TaxID=2710756 RepID=A0A7T1T9L9_9ACTN|nr:hypothetical protein [Streptomyces bathyalis]QPP08884.1 hypothetical protein G4Z16_23510 [Streptomyces bathyalis]
MTDENEPRPPGGTARFRPGKRLLPYPYNRDLSGVLRHLNRSRPEYRAKLANDPFTAAYLAAGMRLLERHLGPGAQGGPHGKPFLLSFLSQRTVADEVANNPRPFPRRGKPRSLRHVWKSQSDFVADLINFAVWEENYRPKYRRQRVANTKRLVKGPDFVHAVHEIAYEHTADGIETPSVRLALALMTSADGDVEVKRAISSMYEEYLGTWKELYADVLRERGLRLRPGLTLDDLANALSAATDGMILRAIGDPEADVVDHDGRRSLFGTVALAIVHSFLEPEGDESGLTLEEAVSARFDNGSR